MPEQKRAGRPRYPPEVRERAVRMVFDHQDEYPSQWKAIESISAKLSINDETLRQWVRRAETDAGQRPGLTTDERDQLKELRREVKELRRVNEMAPRQCGAFDTPHEVFLKSAGAPADLSDALRGETRSGHDMDRSTNRPRRFCERAQQRGRPATVTPRWRGGERRRQAPAPGPRWLDQAGARPGR